METLKEKNEGMAKKVPWAGGRGDLDRKIFWVPIVDR
jgi:hypothetical protein